MGTFRNWLLVILFVFDLTVSFKSNINGELGGNINTKSMKILNNDRHLLSNGNGNGNGGCGNGNGKGNDCDDDDEPDIEDSPCDDPDDEDCDTDDDTDIDDDEPDIDDTDDDHDGPCSYPWIDCDDDDSTTSAPCDDPDDADCDTDHDTDSDDTDDDDHDDDHTSTTPIPCYDPDDRDCDPYDGGGDGDSSDSSSGEDGALFSIGATLEEVLGPIIVIILIILPILLIIIAAIYKTSYEGSDAPNYMSIWKGFAKVADLYTDIAFTFYIWDEGFYLFPICIIFLCISHIISNGIGIYYINKWKNQRVIYFLDYSSICFILNLFGMILIQYILKIRLYS